MELYHIKKLLEKKYNPFIYYRLCLLFSGFIKKNNYYNLLNNAFRNSKESDIDIFKKLLNYFLPPRDNPRNQAEKHYMRFSNMVPRYIINNYLDFGCGKCDMTAEFGRLLNLSKNNIYGTDIKEEFELEWAASRDKNDDLIFKYSTPGDIIPFEKKFDLITCLMVLHHINPTELNKTIKAIYDALNPGGIFLLREHNCENKDDNRFADLVHSLYMVQVAGRVNKEKIENLVIYYKSAEEWNNLLRSFGFEQLQDISYCKLESMASPSRAYYAAYKKV